MLTNPLQRYSPYHKNASAMSSTIGNGTQPQMQVNGLNGLGQNPSHSGQHLPQQANTTGIPLPRAPTRARQHANGSRGSGSSGAIRRRISRACDQCNQLRTKCDGQNPCAHCVEFGLGCEYMRERKKRGKVSKKDLAQQAAAQTAAGSTTAQGSTEPDDADGQRGQIQVSEGFRAHESTQHSNANATNAHEMHGNASNGGDRSMIQQDGAGEKLDGIPEAVGEPQLGGQHGNVGDLQDSTTGLDLNGYGAVSPGYDRTNPGGSVLGDQLYNQAVQGQMGHFPDFSYTMQGHGSPDFAPSGPFRMANNFGFTMGGGPSPGWGMSVPSPTGQIQQHFTHPTVNHSNLRYPVIEPLLPHLNNIIPVALACDLVNLYFASSSSALMHPMSPYILGFLFRKRSFLHPTKPRYCQPALLASMLWVAAQTSDAPLLTSSPSARAKTCQKLLELTISLLRPLIHSTGDMTAGSSPSADGVALGGLGVAMPGTISMDALTGEFGPFGSAGSLDDVVTYIHLATVVSASEYKGASIRWWNAAWSLARELKLGRELPSGPPPMAGDLSNLENETEDVHDIHRNISGYVTEEEREERRRIWWLIYGVDRHLALCYNRPLFLLDVECYGLLQPMDEMKWQAGDFSPFTIEEDGPSEGGMVHGGPQTMRIRGPCFECRGHSIFGYFIPLMTILGEIVDLHHARNHPRFGIGFRSASVWDQQGAEITRHLEIYENSLNEFEQKHLPGAAGAISDQGPDTPSANSILTNGSNRMSEGDIQTRIVIAYGTHVMNVLHILLAGKWDPINLLDDNDLWISSDEFITATGRAVAAAEAIGQILEYDPGLEFMPFFFGIYLLQGSFLLLLIADKLQSEASPSVAKACETIVRAHEACVVTLSTEYQRNFSKVMRSALAQVRGRVPEDLGERHQRRRELLSLYRWTGDGTGLAL